MKYIRDAAAAVYFLLVFLLLFFAAYLFSHEWRILPLRSLRYYRQVVRVARPAGHHGSHLGGQQHGRVAGGLLREQCGT